jgi:hypothetical protein
MEILDPEISPKLEENHHMSEAQFKRQLEDRVEELKQEVVAQPFLCLGIAFVAGFVANTFPARILFQLVFRLVSWLLGPVILLLGVIKVINVFSTPSVEKPSVLHTS